jgi:hypothetical protein
MAEHLELEAAPHFKLRFGLHDLAKVWHIEAQLIYPPVQTSIGWATYARAGRSEYSFPIEEGRPTRLNLVYIDIC